MVSKDKKVSSVGAKRRKGSGVLIRRAESTDVDILVETCRECFPEAIIWQVPRFLARRRWKSILSSSATETWLCSSNAKFVGFVLLVLDMEVYVGKKREQSGGLLLRAYSYISCPRLCLSKVLTRILVRLSGSKKPRACVVSQMISKRPVWIEPIAVVPQMRRKGIAREFLEHSRKRAVELKRDAVKLSVKPSNKAAISLYEKLGFVCTNRGRYTHIYTLKLCCQERAEMEQTAE